MRAGEERNGEPAWEAEEEAGWGSEAVRAGGLDSRVQEAEVASANRFCVQPHSFGFYYPKNSKQVDRQTGVQASG